MTKAPERVPRRMQRFYREAVKEKTQINAEYAGEYSEPGSDYNETYSRRDYSREDSYNGGLENAFKKVDSIDPNAKKNELDSIPSMDYEDLRLDEKNARELKKIGENEMEEKLALFEVEKFRHEKNRMPNKEETSKLAENVYTQLKSDNVDTSTMSRRELRQMRRQQKNPESSSGLGEEKTEEQPRHSRHGTRPQPAQQNSEPPMNTNIGDIGNVKDLLGDDFNRNKNKLDSDMDLGLGDLGEEDDLDSIEDMDFDLDGKKKKKKI
jgi:hypothetical protein